MGEFDPDANREEQSRVERGALNKKLERLLHALDRDRLGRVAVLDADARLHGDARANVIDAADELCREMQAPLHTHLGTQAHLRATKVVQDTSDDVQAGQTLHEQVTAPILVLLEAQHRLEVMEAA